VHQGERSVVGRAGLVGAAEAAQQLAAGGRAAGIREASSIAASRSSAS
jgi:hypothetical protein